MTHRLATLPLAAALLVAGSLGAQQADAATYLGSPDASAEPDAFACAACPAGTSIGFQQFALREATVEAPEDGVLVSAGANAKRIAGAEQPRIVVLRPAAADGVGVTVVDSAPLPVSSATGALHEVDGLHLPVQRGDSIGFLFPTGEVDLGVRMRPRPDGAVQTFAPPCAPCGMDGGTGVELLFDAVVEPDVDQDGLGDESQDPDGGGLGEDWEDDWFDDFEEGGRRPVHHPPDGRHAGQASRARPAAPGRHGARRAAPGATRAGADEGRGLAAPQEQAAQGADALGQAVVGYAARTSNSVSVSGPNDVISATSTASRPRPTTTRPTTGRLLRASNVCQAPSR